MTKYDAVGYCDLGGVTTVTFECRCCGAQRDFGITKEEWLSDLDAGPVGRKPDPPGHPGND